MSLMFWNFESENKRRTMISLNEIYKRTLRDFFILLSRYWILPCMFSISWALFPHLHVLSTLIDIVCNGYVIYTTVNHHLASARTRKSMKEIAFFDSPLVSLENHRDISSVHLKLCRLSWCVTCVVCMWVSGRCVVGMWVWVGGVS